MAAVWRSSCAFSSLLIKTKGQILNNSSDFARKLQAEYVQTLKLYSRCYSSYSQSPFVGKIKEQYKYEIVKNPPEWTYVTRLLPFDTIPEVTPKDTYPSGWIPPKEEGKTWPFFIPRTKNHLLCIYLMLSQRGQRKISMIKKIEGDIWLLNDEIKLYLKTKHGKYIETRVHELARFIEVKGDYVLDLQDWAYAKGF